jgi:hypothetical protein
VDNASRKHSADNHASLGERAEGFRGQVGQPSDSAADCADGFLRAEKRARGK